MQVVYGGNGVLVTFFVGNLIQLVVAAAQTVVELFLALCLDAFEIFVQQKRLVATVD